MAASAVPDPMVQARQKAADQLKVFFDADPHPRADGWTCNKPARPIDLARAQEVRAVLSGYEPMSLSLARQAYQSLTMKSSDICSFCRDRAAAALARLAAIRTQCPHCKQAIA